MDFFGFDISTFLVVNTCANRAMLGVAWYSICCYIGAYGIGVVKTRRGKRCGE